MDKWIPVITLVLGSILTIIGGFITEWSKYSREIRREHSARAYEEFQEWRKFQSETIRELQSTLHELYVLAGHYWVTNTQTGKWDPTPAERMGYAEPNSRTELLRSRVADDETRARVEAAQDAGSNLFGSADRETAAKNWDALNEAYLRAVESAGRAFRAIHRQSEGLES